MKNLKYFFSFLIIFAVFQANAFGYLLGFKSSDNTVQNIQEIEEKYVINLPIVSFIFDPRGDWIIKTMDSLNKELGEKRIYHITLSPNMYSAAEVASGVFDKQYTAFFESIKRNNLKVVFRTMHEMNGGRYPRSSDPKNFQKARIHVRELSRKVGLDQNNILFDMSVNHRDMPTKGIPSQQAKLIPCQLKYKQKLGCFTFEDYYPGDKYVDLMGFTFYNRGKGNSGRRWLTPNEIVNEKGREPLARIKKIGKPIFIDEVATTAVWYTENYNPKLSQIVYENAYQFKNIWLAQLKYLLKSQPDIVGVVYFNVDYTNGLLDRLIGEADWAVINLGNGKIYNTILDLIKNNDKMEDASSLLQLFGSTRFEKGNVKMFLKTKYKRPINDIIIMLDKTYTTVDQKIKALETIQNTKYFNQLYKNLKDEDFNAIYKVVKQIYIK